VIATNTGGTDYIDPKYRSDGTVTVLTDADFIAACNELDLTGTADFIFHPWSSCRITDFDLSDFEIAERNMYIRECRLRLFSDLGAFVKNGQLVYWRAEDRRMPRQIRDRRPLVILAGYMGRERGRHWKKVKSKK